MKKHIIIIGAGMAGLAAASKLSEAGLNVTVLEARNRIGGRTCTDYSFGIPFDLGAFVIHGIQGNPLKTLAETFHAPITPVDPKPFFADQNKALSLEEFTTINQEFEALILAAREYAEQQKQDIPLAEAIPAVFNQSIYPLLTPSHLKRRLSFLPLYTGADLKYLSARSWNKDEILLPGGNYFMLNGYQPIVDGLAKNLAIQLNQIVTHIDYSKEMIQVNTQNMQLTADAVIITVPLSILKNNKLHFHPELPSNKLKAIQHLGMGFANKILLKFPSYFWPKNYFTLANLDTQEEHLFWIHHYYFYDEPILVAYTGGDFARSLEILTDAEITEKVMKSLRLMFGPSIPDPIGVHITRWASDPYALGVYSFIPCGADGRDNDVLAEPVANRLFFAGEATHREFFATVHGAYLSSIREAERILSAHVL